MKPARREQNRDTVREEIKTTAWQLIAEHGASDLSLGAIARQMGLTTPALYRYFPGRDDLVNALIEDAYFSFTEGLKNARSSVSPDQHAERFRRLCLAYREWALQHPQRYILMFGVPIPGYRLGDEAGQAADQSFLVLLDVVAEADRYARLTALSLPELPPALQAQFLSLQHKGKSYAPRVVYLALSAWSFIHGLTSLEIYQRYTLLLGDQTDAFARLEIERFMRSIGLS